jgi:hypothetical protein
MSPTKAVATTDPNAIAQFDVSGRTVEFVIPELGDQLSFDTIGVSLTLRYLGKRYANVDDSEKRFLVLMFEDANGKPYQINAGWKLASAFEDILPNSIVRMTYVKDVETGAVSPMKDYRIEVY